MILDLSENYITDFSPINGLIEFLVEYDNSNQTIPTFKPADVNRNGVVDIIDLVLAASHFDNPDFVVLAQMNIYPDVNNDGVVNIKDLILIASEISPAAAPTLSKNVVDTYNLTTENLKLWIYHAKQLNLNDSVTRKGISILEQILKTLSLSESLPNETVLLKNYPNPFNPETWIPYELSKHSNVNILIHSSDGKLVRLLKLGPMSAGVYHSKSRAAYWDGLNELGEIVASGLYYYTFKTDNITLTRRMLLLK